MTLNLIDVIIGLAVTVASAGGKVLVGVNIRVNARLALYSSNEFCVTKAVLASFTQTISLVAMMMTTATSVPQGHFFLGALGCVAGTFLFPRLYDDQFTRGWLTTHREGTADLRKVFTVAAYTTLNASKSRANHFLVFLCILFPLTQGLFPNKQQMYIIKTFLARLGSILHCK